VRPSETDRFRRMCGQFRGLAIFMVVSVGTLVAFMVAIAPLLLVVFRKAPPPHQQVLALLIWNLPTACYLFGVWSIGRAMGDLAKGGPLQAALPSVLRKVGIALGVGGVASVFLVGNLARLVGLGRGGYLHFDVPGMTLGMIGGALYLLGRVVDQALAAQAELDEMI
jgi:hypothetical protein